MTTTYDPSDPPLMGCGHTANATDGNGGPVCVICVGIVEGAKVVVDRPSLEGRTMTCTCKREPTPSRWDAAFFAYRPDALHDSFYCGCWGWS